MARLTGKAGAATVGGSAVVLTEWTYEESSENVKTTAAGDTYTDRAHIRKDWKATITGRIATTPPYDSFIDTAGTEVAMVLKVLSGDTNGLVTDTGLVERVNWVHPHDDAVEISIDIISSDGSAGPTLDESPAT